MMDNPKFKSALIGGGAFGVLAALPYISMLNSLCCALFIGGGVLATSPKAPYGDGAVVGLLAGVIGGAVATIVGVVVMAVGLAPDVGDASEALRQVEEMGVEIPGFVRDMMGTDGITAAAVATQLLTNVILDGIFSTIGGLVGVAIFHKKDAD